jgi:hypothetical protein
MLRGIAAWCGREPRFAAGAGAFAVLRPDVFAFAIVPTA